MSYDEVKNERLARVLAQLKGVRRSGQGYEALCPAHNDRNPSLSVTEGKGGRVLLNCFAGCKVGAILKAMGLRMADLGGSTPEPAATVHQPTSKAGGRTTSGVASGVAPGAPKAAPRPIKLTPRLRFPGIPPSISSKRTPLTTCRPALCRPDLPSFPACFTPSC